MAISCQYLIRSCSRARSSALQVLLPFLLFDLVEGGAGLVGRRDRLLRPVVHQFVKVVGERAPLVVAVVRLDLSESRDGLRRWRWRGRQERRRGLAGDRRSSAGAQRRP